MQPPVDPSLFKRQWITHLMDAALTAASLGMKPLLSDRLDGVLVERDLPYRPGGDQAHNLDIYRPRNLHGLAPAVFYIHGGGFSILSKETHWIYAAEFSRRGYLTVLPNYRLAPEHKFPAAVEDVCAAWLWFVRQAPSLGVDLNRVVVAGESAGANLSLSLMLAMLEQRSEPYAAPVYEAGIVPRTVIPACGFLDVTRYRDDPQHSAFVASRVRNVLRSYVGGATFRDEREKDLADPVVVLEGDKSFARPLPPIFVPCGAKDPVVSSSTRLGAALARRGAPHQLKLYPGEGHAFNAFVFRAQAQQCWRDTFAFLEAHGVGPQVVPPPVWLESSAAVG